MSLAETLTNRELLRNLTLRELRTRYRRSVLGWAWSLINPLATMVIFTIVFSQVFRAPEPIGEPSGLESFPLYLLCGLLPWSFFSVSVGASMGSLAANSGLVKKVWFPREVLVVSTTFSLVVSLAIELGVLCVALLIAGNMVVPWLVPLAILVALLTTFTIGLALIFSALNVFYRDVGYLWTILAQAWFYLTPIVYPIELAPDWLRSIVSAQPMGGFVVAFHNLLYDLRWPSAARWAHLVVCAAGALALGQWVFARMSPRFAEEL
jgi:ABC-type polysaccharide/polyol phosphate export permease